MTQKDDIQVQNIPVNIDYDDPKAIRKLIDVAKQTVQRLTEAEKRIQSLENIILE